MRLILIMLTVLSGCAALDTYTTVAVQRAQETNDRILRDTKFVWCNGLFVGAWMREFGDKPDQASAWRTTCHKPATELPIQ